MIYIASDHAGYKLKEKLKKLLSEKTEDLGPNNYNKNDDYPDYAEKLAKKVQKNGKGILICGSGQGMCRTANKFKGICAALAWNEKSALSAKKHNNSNVICLSGKLTKPTMAKKIVKIWLKTKFEGGRHTRRIKKIKKIEKRNMK